MIKAKNPNDLFDLDALIGDMEVSVDKRFPGPNPAFIVSHPKHYKAIIQGARDAEHAKQLFAESIIKGSK